MSAPDEAVPSNKGKAIDPRNWGNLTFNDAEVDVEAQQKALDDIRNNARPQRPFIEDLSDEEEQQPLLSSSSGSDGARAQHDGHTGDVDSGTMLQLLSEGDYSLQRMDLELVSNSREPQSNFFQNAQHMEISNSTFISHVHAMPTQPQESSAFRKIYCGDIEIERVHRDTVTDIWSRNHARKVRKIMASATIHPYGQKMTVMLYKGENAKEAWIRDIKMHSHIQIWQSSIRQLYATMSSPGLYATVSHGDPIPTTELWHIHADNPLLRAKLRLQLFLVYWEHHQMLKTKNLPFLFCQDIISWSYLEDYFFDESKQQFRWMIGATYGQPTCAGILSRRNGIQGLPITEIDDQSANFCNIKLALLDKTTAVAIISPSWVKWRCLFIDRAPNSNRILEDLPKGFAQDVTETGWTRLYFSSALAGRHIRALVLLCSININISRWLSQARNTLNRLINAGLESEKLILIALSFVTLRLDDAGSSLWTIPEQCPSAYLFLCPVSIWPPPETLFYWSLDPEGNHHLSPQEMKSYGLPNWKPEVVYDHWAGPEEVYEEIDAIHNLHGFDPESQDVAKSLGYPLFKVFKETTNFFEDSWTPDGEVSWPHTENGLNDLFYNVEEPSEHDTNNIYAQRSQREDKQPAQWFILYGEAIAALIVLLVLLIELSR